MHFSLLIIDEKKSTGKRDSIGKPAEGEKDQLNSHSPSQENDISAKKSFFDKIWHG